MCILLTMQVLDNSLSLSKAGAVLIQHKAKAALQQGPG
jgi:hypothetical protein